QEESAQEPPRMLRDIFGLGGLTRILDAAAGNNTWLKAARRQDWLDPHAERIAWDIYEPTPYSPDEMQTPPPRPRDRDIRWVHDLTDVQAPFDLIHEAFIDTSDLD